MEKFTLRDPGYNPKEVTFDGTEEGFMEALAAEGGPYTNARYISKSKIRFYAWRPMEKDAPWQPGSFKEAVIVECVKLGFEPGPFIAQDARDLYEDGWTLKRIAEYLRPLLG